MIENFLELIKEHIGVQSTLMLISIMENRMKTCTKCGVEKPPDEFYNRKDAKDGKRKECKTCRKDFGNKYYQNNREKIREQIKNRENYPEKNKENCRKYRKEHREELNEKQRKRNESQREEQKEYSKRYYEEHKEERKEYDRKRWEENKVELKRNGKIWYEKNKEHCKKRSKEYYEEHKEEISERVKEWRKTDPCQWVRIAGYLPEVPEKAFYQ